MAEKERILSAYPESLTERWLVLGEAKYLKLQAKKEANKRPNINKLLAQLNLDDLKKRL